MDFEVILNEARQLKQKLLGFKDQIDRLLDIENPDLLCNNIDLELDGIRHDSDQISTMSEKIEVSLDVLVTYAKQKQSDSVICKLCCQRLALGIELCTNLPSMSSVM